MKDEVGWQVESFPQMAQICAEWVFVNLSGQRVNSAGMIEGTLIGLSRAPNFES
ncbi:MAG: hypothetical protein ACK417_01780 [Bacteroidia bacterium]